jgi:transcriptional regulator with XRE-family HTH domain
MANLHDYLRRPGVTQSALAAAAGVSPAMLNQVKAGIRRPSPELARRIEQATGGEVSAASLLGLESETPAPAQKLDANRWRIEVAPDGALLLPPEAVDALGLASNRSVVLKLEGRELRLVSVDESVRRAQALIRRKLGSGRRLSDELIAERRAEAARD